MALRGSTEWGEGQNKPFMCINREEEGRIWSATDLLIGIMLVKLKHFLPGVLRTHASTAETWFELFEFCTITGFSAYLCAIWAIIMFFSLFKCLPTPFSFYSRQFDTSKLLVTPVLYTTVTSPNENGIFWPSAFLFFISGDGSLKTLQTHVLNQLLPSEWLAPTWTHDFIFEWSVKSDPTTPTHLIQPHLHSPDKYASYWILYFPWCNWWTCFFVVYMFTFLVNAHIIQTPHLQFVQFDSVMNLPSPNWHNPDDITVM